MAKELREGPAKSVLLKGIDKRVAREWSGLARCKKNLYPLAKSVMGKGLRTRLQRV
jgi:hypothetical protein